MRESWKSRRIYSTAKKAVTNVVTGGLFSVLVFMLCAAVVTKMAPLVPEKNQP